MSVYVVEGYGPSILGCAASACSSWHATATLPHPCGPPYSPKLLARHTLVTAACSLCFITIFFPRCRKYYDLELYEKQQAAKVAKKGAAAADEVRCAAAVVTHCTMGAAVELWSRCVW